ncbi:MAG TPA: nucleotide sugar dehydrogenase [Atribacteraceae bacterium]|nr:nucleotide sugar dehydrogenase [Atribacteraceae bacterium]
MNLFPGFDDFSSGRERIAVVGLGYVGLPLALLLAKRFSVIGFDRDQSRIAELSEGEDRRKEVPPAVLAASSVEWTSQPDRLHSARLLIITVSTPVDDHRNPDLTFLASASRIVGKYLTQGSVVVYESTVYPGVTEGVCIPILERESGLRHGRDFRVGYSPERVNPGDLHHTLERIVKVVAGCCGETLELLARVYGSVIEAGVYRAPSIKTAEAAKVIENTQRDLNIALMNELAIIFHRLGLDTREVLEAAGTKWNFLPFEPGLVGGHCIGVDPYYLTYKAEETGYLPQVILAGRRINDSMGNYVAEQTVKLLLRAEKGIKNARILIMGVAFKENVRDVRNSRVIDIERELREFAVDPLLFDPVVLKSEVEEEYGITLLEEIGEKAPYDAVVLAVRHREFSPYYGVDALLPLFRGVPVLVDVKGACDRRKAEAAGWYWRL